MKPIFAPWRMEFILGPREKGCVFCNRIRRKSDRKDLIVKRGKTCFVILNKYPYNPGHLMVVPNRHVSSLTALTAEEHSEIFKLLAEAEKVMSKAMRPQGFNMGLNLGKAAGAGIDDHLHYHVIPRWFADTNFWPTIAATKSIPTHLLQTVDLLKKFWK